MNGPDPWAAFAEVFAEELAANTTMTPEQFDEMADAYQREAIASANSEQAFAATQQEYRNAAHQR